MGSIHEDIVSELQIKTGKRLTGEDMGDLLYKAKPEREYPVGHIYPKPDDTESMKPTSAGFEFDVKNNEEDTKIEILTRGHFYVRRKPTLKEFKEYLSRYWEISNKKVEEKLKEKPIVSLPYCWAYIPFKNKTLVKYGEDKEIDLTNVLKKAWEDKNIESAPYNTENEELSAFEGKGRNWNSEKDYEEWLKENFSQPIPTPQDETHKLIGKFVWNYEKLECYVINNADRPSNAQQGWYFLDQNIYGLNFQIKFSENIQVKPNKTFLEDSFKAQAKVKSWGEGRNLQIDKEKNKKIFHARPLGRQEKNRSYPKESLEGIDLTFKSLSEDPIPPSQKVLDYLKEYLGRYKDINKKINTEQTKQSVEKINSIINRVSEGIDLLESNEEMVEAFKLMNKTFYRQYICDEDIESWRLFQFVYILGKITHINSQNKNKRDMFDIIFVPTGGGKTETYFGFIITTMFYLRLCEVNAGTVGIVKFPLRMLSIDQIQRIAPLIAVANMVRKEHEILGGPKGDPEWLHEFSVGFMIGGSSSSSTPNRVHAYKGGYSSSRNSNEEELPEENKGLYDILTENPEEIQVIHDCPVCRYEDHKEGHSCEKEFDTIEVSYDEEGIRGKHICKECETRFPIHWSDEECFRYLPTIIVSTQDRIAYPAFAPHTRGLFGAPLYVCPEHGFSIYNDSCTPYKKNGGYGKKEGNCSYLNKREKLPEFELDASKRAVRYVIQDEMHLLNSELGALDSPFEKMIEDVVEYYANRKPQYIGMSASVQGVEKQVKEIYGKNKTIWLYPGDPPNDNFAERCEMDAFFDHTDELSRLFVGMMPSLSDPSIVVSKAIDTTSNIIEKWENNSVNNNGNLPNVLQSYNEDELINALRWYRVHLSFMRTKIDLERTIQNINNIVNVERRKRNRNNSQQEKLLKVQELTGDNSINDIRDAMNKIKKSSQKKTDTELDVLVATNLVSHGIDLKEMNIMTFYGLPNATAEYLQAFSRVGRIFPGLVFIIYHPKRARDRGLWKTFDFYHKALRQQVELMPVDHRAPGLLNETLVTLLRCYWNLIAEQEIDDEKQNLYKLKDIIEKYMKYREIVIDNATNRIIKWLEWDDGCLQDIQSNIENYLDILHRYHDISKRRNKIYHNKRAHSPPPVSHKEFLDLISSDSNQIQNWMSTMTGIRGIQPNFKHYGDSFTKIYLDLEGEE